MQDAPCVVRSIMLVSTQRVAVPLKQSRHLDLTRDHQSPADSHSQDGNTRSSDLECLNNGHIPILTALPTTHTHFTHLMDMHEPHRSSPYCTSSCLQPLLPQQSQHAHIVLNSGSQQSFAMECLARELDLLSGRGKTMSVATFGSKGRRATCVLMYK